MDNEDDILNVDFDPNDLENVDEDALLGRLTPPTKPVRISVEFESLPEVKPTINLQTFPRDRQKETSSNKIELNSDDSDNEIREKTHDKFKSEQGSTAPKRIRSERKDIPDSLDEVKIPQNVNQQEKSAFYNNKSIDKRRYSMNNRKNRRGNVLLNPHFKGTITADPNLRLAWDMGHHRMPVHLNKVTMISPSVRLPPALHLRPFNDKPMSLVGPPLHMPPPRMSGMHPTIRPLMSVAGGIPYPPPAVSKSMQQPPPSLIPSPANAARVPPPPAHLNRPPPSLFSRDVLPPPNNQRSSAPVKPLIDTSRPPPFQPPAASSRGGGGMQPANDWLATTEDFLRRLQTSSVHNGNGNSSQQTSSKVSRERQAAASIRRKYGIRSGDRIRNSMESQRTSYQDYQSPYDYSSVNSYQLIDIRKEAVDDEYLRKLDEQKRLREELNKRKEIRRQQEIAEKQRGKGQPETPPKKDTVKRVSDSAQKRDSSKPSSEPYSKIRRA